MKIKKGDKVKIMSGSDKGKEGIVQAVYPKINKIVVENVNVHKRHKKPTQQTPEGSVLDIYVPIDASKVMLIDPKTKKTVKVGYKVTKEGKVRVNKKTGEKI